jgi:phosphohistidine phosphatase
VSQAGGPCQVILVRHAHAEWPGYDGRDFDRPLTARGQSDAHAAGQAMRAAGHCPAVVVASPARRTRQTAEILCGELGLAAGALSLVDALYNAPGSTLRAQLRLSAADAGGPVMLVAHNPGISELGRLLGTDPHADAFAPADWRVLPLR